MDGDGPIFHFYPKTNQVFNLLSPATFSAKWDPMPDPKLEVPDIF